MLPNTWKKSIRAIRAMCRQIVLITFIMFAIKYSVSYGIHLNRMYYWKVAACLKIWQTLICLDKSAAILDNDRQYTDDERVSFSHTQEDSFLFSRCSHLRRLTIVNATWANIINGRAH
jgi:hypothetical protein